MRRCVMLTGSRPEAKRLEVGKSLPLNELQLSLSTLLAIYG